MDELPQKPVVWLGTTRSDLQGQRKAIRDELGHQLYRVQLGLWPNNYKPMDGAVGPGTVEIRVKDADGIARLMYVGKFGSKVHVLHVFTKKTRTTPKADKELAKKRYREAKDG